MKTIVVHNCRLGSGTGRCDGSREAFHLFSIDDPQLYAREAHCADRLEHPA